VTRRGGWGNLTALLLFGQIMLNYQNLFEIELKKLIISEQDRIKDNLSNGLSVVDFADYRHQVGKILGLQSALDLCEEANSILSKR
jgi:hypothetical protein